MNVSLMFCTVFFMVLVFEAYLTIRYSNDHKKMEAEYDDRDLCFQAAADSRLIYEYVPNKCGNNSAGFVDTNHEIEKTPGTLRVLVVGDSVAVGQGVERDARFSNLLSKKLNSMDELPPVEIINIAHTGYSTSQELVLLKNVGIAYSPDLIVWSYVLNDPADPIFHDASGELVRYFYYPKWRGLHYLSKKLFQVSENAKRKECGEEFHQLMHCAYREEIVSNIAELGALSEDAKIPVLFAIHPVFEKDGDFEEYGYASIHADLSRIVSSEGMMVVDLAEAMQGFAPDQLHQENDYWFDPWHPNELGHRLTAEYLTRPVVVSLGE